MTEITHHATSGFLALSTAVVITVAVAAVVIGRFPSLRRRLRSSALLGRLLQGVIACLGVISAVAIVTWGRDASANEAALLAAGQSVVNHQTSYLSSPSLILGLNGVLLAYLVYRTRLVPRSIVLARTFRPSVTSTLDPPRRTPLTILPDVIAPRAPMREPGPPAQVSGRVCAAAGEYPPRGHAVIDHPPAEVGQSDAHALVGSWTVRMPDVSGASGVRRRGRPRQRVRRPRAGERGSGCERPASDSRSLG